VIITLRTHEGKKLCDVEAEPLKQWPGFAVHKTAPPYDRYYRVSHIETGACVPDSDGLTKEEAIRQAEAALSRRTAEYLKKRIRLAKKKIAKARQMEAVR